MKPEAQPVPHQDSRQAKAAVGCDPHRKAAWPRHPRICAAPARTPSQARSVPNHQGWTHPAHWRGLNGLRREGSGYGGRPVGAPPSFMAAHLPASRTVRDCTTGCSKVCRTPASRTCG